MFLSRTARFLLVASAGLWLGAAIMLGFGVAPVNFGVAEQWELTGSNPVMPEQNVNYRTIGGELTGLSIIRMNQLESVFLMLMVIGLAIMWSKDYGKRNARITLSVLVLCSAILFTVYALWIGAEMTEIRTTVPLDFSIEDDALKSDHQLRFDALHPWYTRLMGLNMIVLASILAVTEFRLTESR